MPVTKNLSKIIIFFLAFFSWIFPQETEPLVTDRPDITESALTVPLNSFQVETGFLLQNTSEDINGINIITKSHSLLNTLLRYGLFSFLELRAGTEYLSEKYSGISDNPSGLSGILIGTKIQLNRDNSSFPDAALFFHFTLPLGNESLRLDKVEPEILIALSQSLSKMFALSSNIGGSYISTEKKLHYLYTFSLGISLSEKTATFIEIFGETASEVSNSISFDTGLTYLIQDNIQFDLSAGANFNAPSSNWFMGTGISFRIPD